MKKLDEKGFVFIDDDSKPFWIRMYFGIPKIMYWNQGQQSWVVLRDATQGDIRHGESRKIPDDQAELYHQMHSRFIGAG